MAAVSSQPCTAWAAPEPLPRLRPDTSGAAPGGQRRHSAPRPSRRDGGCPRHTPNMPGGNRPLTHTKPRARSRQASWRGPSRPARRRGQWGTARQEPANTQTRPWNLAALPRRRRLHRDGEQPLVVLPARLPSPPAPLPPAGRPRSPAPLPHRHAATLSPPARGYKQRIGCHVTRGPLSEPMAGRAPPAPRAEAGAEGARALLRAGVWGSVASGFCFFVLVIKELYQVRFNHASAYSQHSYLNTVQPAKQGKKISSVKPQ